MTLKTRKQGIKLRVVNGKMSAAIWNDVLREIPAPKKISVHTIHRLLLLPNKNRKACKRCKSLVDAMRPPKRNDFHYTLPQVSFIGELTQLFSDEMPVIAISADDKNTVNVGTLAVSRHFSVNNILAKNDQHSYPDHDFPYSNAKLVPAGYLVLKTRQRRSRSLSSPRTNQWVGAKKKYPSSSAPPNSSSRSCNLKGLSHSCPLDFVKYCQLVALTRNTYVP